MKSTYTSWAILGIAVCAWVAAGFFIWTVESAAVAQAAADTVAQEQQTAQTSALRLHGVARETEEDRAKLHDLTSLDVVSIIESIEAVGDAAHVPVEIGQALADQRQNSGGVTRSVDVVVEARGSFTNLMRAVSLLYTLPIPSKITEIQLERLAEVSGKAEWRLVAHVRVLTTIDISI